MKHLTVFAMLILTSMMLGACGGGSAGGAASSPVTQTPPNAGSAEQLILNSGRGTVNNQDTEQSSD